MPRTPIDRAFDDHKPPEIDLIEDCVHCGFCLPTCPTYALWSEEMDSPRGRIVLMSEGLQEGSTLTDTMVDHFDNCLGCMACVTACPSGVRYDLLLEDTRAQVERVHTRTLRERLLRRALFSTFPHPGRLRATVPLIVASRRLGLARRMQRSRLLSRLPTLRTLMELAPPVKLRDTVHRLPAVTPAVGERRGTVGFLQGCVQRAYFGDVNAATVAVLAAEGFEVHAPREPRCCGALGLHSGQEEHALALAKATISALERFDLIVVNAAGCGSAIKDYGHLLRDDPEWSKRARRLGEKARDVHELLASVQPRAKRHPVALQVAYHDACHLAHAQSVRAQPRELLRSIPGVELVEPAEWELCCGSAGIYNLTRPEAAAQLGARKADNLLATGAAVIAAANPGCTLQIAAHLQRKGQPLEIVHPMQLLARSIAGGDAGGAGRGGRLRTAVRRVLRRLRRGS
ncbi:MAG: glycolate oxidase iron-sulfur subunit [Solirubrobacteraceae bacterium]|jgi:glycolate oxidase iron-sulfur subunit|nr:glycolate oxidase iron-sulfur subunit [Solirubrobacteraceae bacterium]